jgi:hypothetical protein
LINLHKKSHKKEVEGEGWGEKKRKGEKKQEEKQAYCGIKPGGLTRLVFCMSGHISALVRLHLLSKASHGLSRCSPAMCEAGK